MNQYFSELLTTSLIALLFIIGIFGILYCIYHSNKKNGMHFKTFLDGNKIYIEIFLVICLSFMSIIIATNANIIADNELKIQKANNQPIFVFDEIRYGNGFYEKLIVYNFGASLNEFHSSSIVLLKIHSYKDNNLKEITIPIGYYDISTRSGNDSRELQEFFASDTEPLNGNYYRLCETIGRFYEISRNDNLSGGINVYKYVYIKYEDIYGEKHDDLYVISELHPHKISEEEKEKILFDIQERPFLDIKDLTAEKIYNIFKASY